MQVILKLWLLFTKPCFLFPITSYSHVPTNSLVYYSSWFDHASIVLELSGELLNLAVLCLFILLTFPKLLLILCFRAVKVFSYSIMRVIDLAVSAMVLSWPNFPFVTTVKCWLFACFPWSVYINLRQQQMVLQVFLVFFGLSFPGFAFESTEHEPFSSFRYLTVVCGTQHV